MPEVKDRQFLIAMHKRAKKANFNIDEYNRLKEEAAKIEKDLRRIRDPLYLRAAPAGSSSLYTTEQDRLFQTALTSPTVAAMDKPTITQRLSNMFTTAAKKLQK